jgi:hypothetical protein
MLIDLISAPLPCPLLQTYSFMIPQPNGAQKEWEERDGDYKRADDAWRNKETSKGASIGLHTAQCYIPDDRNVYIRSDKNPKSHICM